MKASESKTDGESDHVVFNYVAKVSELATFTVGFADHNCPGDDFELYWNVAPTLTGATKLIGATGVSSTTCEPHLHSINQISEAFAYAKTQLTVQLTATESIYFIINPVTSPYGGGTGFFQLKLESSK